MYPHKFTTCGTRCDGKKERQPNTQQQKKEELWRKMKKKKRNEEIRKNGANRGRERDKNGNEISVCTQGKSPRYGTGHMKDWKGGIGICLLASYSGCLSHQRQTVSLDFSLHSLKEWHFLLFHFSFFSLPTFSHPLIFLRQAFHLQIPCGY